VSALPLIEHADAILTLLLIAAPDLTVHDGHVPALPTYPYAVLYLGWDAERTSLCPAADLFHGRARITCVGANAAAARIVSKRVAGALKDVVPTIPGRTCWPIEHDFGLSPVEDRDVHIDGTGFVVYSVDEYRISSVPG
jgi:hypothetical protein